VTPEVKEFLATYQSRAAAEGVDRSAIISAPGVCLYGAARNAITVRRASTTIRSPTILRSNPVKTIMGDIKFGKGGEWAESRMLQVQYHGIKGNTVDQFKGMDTQTVLTPADLKTATSSILREGEIVRREHQMANGPGCVAASGTGNVGLRDCPERRGISALQRLPSTTINARCDRAQATTITTTTMS